MILGAISILAAIGLFAVYLVLRSVSGAASSVLADEFKASAPEMAQKVIRLASQRLPEDSRADMLETWLAEVSEYESRPLKALKFALWNCLAAAPGVARQLRPAPQPVGQNSHGIDREQRLKNGSDATGLYPRLKSRLTIPPHIRRGPLALLKHAIGYIVNGILMLLLRLRHAGEEGKKLGEVSSAVFVRQVALLRDWIVATVDVATSLFQASKEFLGPYDFSRERRSVAQLVVRVALMSIALSLVFGIGATLVDRLQPLIP